MKNNLAYIFMLAVTLTSCNGFLDIKPDDKTIPETPEDFSAIIHEMCDEIERTDQHSRSESGNGSCRGIFHGLLV